MAEQTDGRPLVGWKSSVSKLPTPEFLEAPWLRKTSISGLVCECVVSLRW